MMKHSCRIEREPVAYPDIEMMMERNIDDLTTMFFVALFGVVFEERDLRPLRIYALSCMYPNK